MDKTHYGMGLMAFAPVFGRPFPATFDRHAAVAAAGNGLLNNLIAYWPGDEASGDLLDAHTNGLDLTDNNTVTSAAGKVYSTARQYTRANAEYHSRTSSAELQVSATTDFTIALWVYLDSMPGQMYILTKMSEATLWEYAIDYYASRFRWWWYGSGVDSEVRANSLGAPSTGQWYLIVAWHDSVADTLSVQVDGGAVDSTSYTGGNAPFAASGDLMVGTTLGSARLDGRLGPIAFWKSAAGAGGALSADQRTALYNGGAGLAYAAFTT